MTTKLVSILKRQKQDLREALTQVKVDHLNKKVKLPLKTHAMLENVLSDTAEVQHSRRVRTVERSRKPIPTFKYVRHPTPRAVLNKFTGKSGWKLDDITFGSFSSDHPDLSASEVILSIKAQGLWGFTETHAKPPIIHYWHDGKRSEDLLVRFFAHEMGHNVGPKATGLEEEHRADDYSDVAALALAQAKKERARRKG